MVIFVHVNSHTGIQNIGILHKHKIKCQFNIFVACKELQIHLDVTMVKPTYMTESKRFNDLRKTTTKTTKKYYY